MKNIYPIIFGLLVFNGVTQAVENTPSVQTNTLQQRTQRELPYSLDQTVQTFTKTVHGGVQHVVVKSADNTSQIKLIQAHLLKTVEQFRKGDFSLTERQHGPNMPGLIQLKMANPNDIKFEYKALENGGQIHYSTEYPQFVQALHEWFDAQVSEHGNAVLPTHSQHHSTTAE